MDELQVGSDIDRLVIKRAIDLRAIRDSMMTDHPRATESRTAFLDLDGDSEVGEVSTESRSVGFDVHAPGSPCRTDQHSKVRKHDRPRR